MIPPVIYFFEEALYKSIKEPEESSGWLYVSLDLLTGSKSLAEGLVSPFSHFKYKVRILKMHEKITPMLMKDWLEQE